MLRNFRIIDGYCVDEYGMRVGIVRDVSLAYGYTANEVRFFDDRFVQSGNDVRLRVGRMKVVGKIQLA